MAGEPIGAGRGRGHPRSGRPGGPRDLAGAHLAPGDGQDPLDLGGRGGLAPGGGAQPGPHGGAGEGDRGRRQGPGVGDVDLGGQGGDQVGVVGEQRGLAGQDGDDVAPGHVVQQGQDLVADPVAEEAGVVVARVLDRSQPLGGAEGPGLGAPQGEDRVPGAGAQRPQAGGPRPPQQVEQDRLGPVVERVAGAGVGPEDGPPGGPGPGLQVRPVLHGDPRGPEPRPAALGRGGHDGGLGGGSRPEPVVDVHRRHLAPRRARQGQQRQRVGPARHPGGDRRPGRRERAPRQQCLHGVGSTQPVRRRRPGRARTWGRGSRSSWGGWPDPPRPGRAASRRRPPRPPR
jgi:hypothetical protein